uniref:MIOS-like alpha-solenoid domain-containing protein n=1 Tax=Timema cristinae TaxID=61476 RepID=A0A7R9GTJ6_TIMCR|nr:unnamed protein product [Timema cristinae]
MKIIRSRVEVQREHEIVEEARMRLNAAGRSEDSKKIIGYEGCSEDTAMETKEEMAGTYSSKCASERRRVVEGQREMEFSTCLPNSRHNLLGSLVRDSPALFLYDIQHTTVGNEEVEPSVLERSVIPGTGNNIASFSWHPSHENRLLAISLSGGLTDYVVFERITLNWSPSSHVVWTHGRRFLKLITDKDQLYTKLNDTSVTIKRRALTEYGLKEDLWQNGDLADDDDLKNLWYWLYLSRSLVEEGNMWGVNSRLPGVRSDDREKALQLCGWKFDRETTFMAFLDRLESDEAYSRAAAIAVFSLKLRLSIEILNRGFEAQIKMGHVSSLNIVAMALSGFSDDRNSMWRELCLKSLSQLTDPYLRAMFAFLTAENGNYDAVLNESGMAVEDQVAFALTFLSDQKLGEYLKHLTNKLVQEGDLAGMLLTGTNHS